MHLLWVCPLTGTALFCVGAAACIVTGQRIPSDRLKLEPVEVADISIPLFNPRKFGKFRRRSHYRNPVGLVCESSSCLSLFPSPSRLRWQHRAPVEVVNEPVLQFTAGSPERAALQKVPAAMCLCLLLPELDFPLCAKSEEVGGAGGRQLEMSCWLDCLGCLPESHPGLREGLGVFSWGHSTQQGANVGPHSQPGHRQCGVGVGGPGLADRGGQWGVSGHEGQHLPRVVGML